MNKDQVGKNRIFRLVESVQPERALQICARVAVLATPFEGEGP